MAGAVGTLGRFLILLLQPLRRSADVLDGWSFASGIGDLATLAGVLKLPELLQGIGITDAQIHVWAHRAPYAVLVLLLAWAAFRLQRQIDRLIRPRVRILFDPDDTAFFYVSRREVGTSSEYEDGRIAYVAVENLSRKPIRNVVVKLDRIDGFHKSGYAHVEAPSAPLQRKEQYLYGDRKKKAGFTLHARQQHNPAVARQYIAVAKRKIVPNPHQRTGEIDLCYSPNARQIEDGKYTLTIGVYGDVGDQLGSNQYVVGVDEATGQMTFENAKSPS